MQNENEVKAFQLLEHLENNVFYHEQSASYALAVDQLNLLVDSICKMYKKSLAENENDIESIADALEIHNKNKASALKEFEKAKKSGNDKLNKNYGKILQDKINNSYDIWLDDNSSKFDARKDARIQKEREDKRR